MTLIDDIKKRVEAAENFKEHCYCEPKTPSGYGVPCPNCKDADKLATEHFSDLRYLLGIAEAAQKLLDVNEKVMTHDLRPRANDHAREALSAAIEGKGAGQ